MKIIVRPILDPRREIDLTNQLVSAIAEELWRLFGGNETLNWIEAEWHLQGILAQARDEAVDTAVVRVAPSERDRARRPCRDAVSARPSAQHEERQSRRERPNRERVANWKPTISQVANATLAPA